MHSIVRSFFDKHFMGAVGPYRVLVGLSGGADSVALLLALRGAGCECVAAHCNFHLRGEESNRDERFCRELCERLGVKLEVVHFDVSRRQLERNESVEMACRSLRYEWWDRLMTTGRFDFLAIGHHLEDNVETLFLNLIRGAGLKGVKGMLPVSYRRVATEGSDEQVTVIRPLLEVSRAEIERFVSEQGCEWITDSTNAQNDYSRNRLRNKVLPALEDAFPGALEAISHSMSHLRDNYAVYSELIGKVSERVSGADGSIDVRRLFESEPRAKEILFDILSLKGFNPTQVDDISSLFCPGEEAVISGQRYVNSSGSWLMDRGVLRRIEECDEELKELSVDRPEELPFAVNEISREEFKRLVSEGCLGKTAICLDAKCVESGQKWTLRPWHEGDRMEPYGMKGSRLVSDIFNDSKISAARRAKFPVLVLGDTLIWVTGLRASRHYPVTPATERIMCIRIPSTDFPTAL